MFSYIGQLNKNIWLEAYKNQADQADQLVISLLDTSRLRQREPVKGHWILHVWNVSSRKPSNNTQKKLSFQKLF